MKLKNRVEIYSLNGKKVNYLNPREFTTEIYFKYHTNTNKKTWLKWMIPQQCETPRDIEMYVRGFEDVNWDYVVKREDIEI